jgi:hypothetical protein
MSISRPFPIRSFAISLTAGLALGAAGAAWAADDDAHACTETATLLLSACKYEVRDDFLVAQAICENVAGEAAQDECENEAGQVRSEGNQLCGEQRSARLELCADLGGGRYDANFEPALFDDPKRPSRPNPYYPLRVGNRWVYEDEGETVVVTVLNETKLIEGVECITVNDVVEIDGAVHEDTDDWYGIRKNGTVDYCGEIVQNFESFEGDDPARPELVDVDGSWKHGRDGALAGTQFLASPQVGRVYRQEFAAGNAEDAAEILSKTYRFGSNAVLDQYVPAPLAQLLCSAGNCVVTGEFSPIEPGKIQRKYYARGIGLFLEVNPETGSSVQLVECNVDPKCNSL